VFVHVNMIHIVYMVCITFTYLSMSPLSIFLYIVYIVYISIYSVYSVYIHTTMGSAEAPDAFCACACERARALEREHRLAAAQHQAAGDTLASHQNKIPHATSFKRLQPGRHFSIPIPIYIYIYIGYIYSYVVWATYLNTWASIIWPLRSMQPHPESDVSPDDPMGRNPDLRARGEGRASGQTGTRRPGQPGEMGSGGAVPSHRIGWGGPSFLSHRGTRAQGRTRGSLTRRDAGLRARCGPGP
jgi:hypothetical protein